MTPFIGQIQAFGFNFSPRGWAFCDGQLLVINQNAAFTNANLIKNLANGAAINTANAVLDNGNDLFCQGGQGGDLGQFCPGTTGYVGFEKDEKLGWMRISVGSGGFKLIVHEYAYNNTAGQAINAGQTTQSVPVEMISFKAMSKENNIQLTWTTASEENNAGFEVQRSTNGKTFRTLDFVEGHGTTVEKQEYFYDDKELRKGQTYYYRLKQIDYDGQFEYSEVITASLKDNGDKVGEFFPNPAIAGATQLAYTSAADADLSVAVYSVAGKLLYSEVHRVVAGDNLLSFDFQHLTKGTVFIKLTEEGVGSVYKKLVIQ